ncbi:MAG TPA: hypothetical protein VK652_10750 [Steroidobacteraceae bacterium]|nr:hypothetical protein [Steroidobacteraceae bacterium]
MPEIEPVIGTTCARRQPRCAGLREHTLIAVFISCVCGSEALAKDQTLGSEGPLKPGAEFSALFALPISFDEPRAFSATEFRPRRQSLGGADAPLTPGAKSSALFALPISFDEPRAFSATEFRARRQGLGGADPAKRESSVIDAPMLDSSVARQWRESKSQGRVRLLTLWQSSLSSVSLQAGKHGMPSLQWSTPWMHRDVASRGLFDRFLTVSPRSGGGGSRSNVPRQAGTFAASKPADLSASLK